MEADVIKNDINAASLKEIAETIIQSCNDVRRGAITLEEGRLRISACKHLLQIMALEVVRENGGHPEALPSLSKINSLRRNAS